MYKTRNVVDILVRSPQGRPIAIAEVKNWADLDREVASELLDILLDAELKLETPVPYLMIVSQTVGFLWVKPKVGDLPILEFSMQEVIPRYEADGHNLVNPTDSHLQLVILKWFTDLAWLTEESTTIAEKQLAQTGFIEAIREALILIEVQV